MYDTTRELVEAMRDVTVVIQGLLHGCSQEEAQTTREAPGEWSILEVVCHLRDGEERALERMRAMRDQERPYIAPFDQNAWVVERNYASANLHAAIEAFLRFRTQYLHELAALPPEAWERPGAHPEIGEITIQSHTLHRLCHDLGHAAQLARQRKLARGLPTLTEPS